MINKNNLVDALLDNFKMMDDAGILTEDKLDTLKPYISKMTNEQKGIYNALKSKYSQVSDTFSIDINWIHQFGLSGATLIVYGYLMSNKNETNNYDCSYLELTSTLNISKQNIDRILKSLTEKYNLLKYTEDNNYIHFYL